VKKKKMEKTRKIGKSLVTGVVLVVLLATAGLVFAAGNQAQEEEGIFQSWDTLGDAVMNGNTDGQAEHLWLYKKDPITWVPDMSEDATWGRLVYFNNENPNSESAPKGEFVFNAAGLDVDANTQYRLINFARKAGQWPPTINCLGDIGTANSDGNLYMRGSFAYDVLEFDESDSTANGVGYKIWLVPETSADCTGSKLIGWDPELYLFENNLINPEDNGQNNPLENAVEVAPGVFYLGESIDNGKVVEGYAFVHYVKPAATSELVWDDTVDLYKFMFGGIKWADTMQYEVNPEGSKLDPDDVMPALTASLETWDSKTSFELFGDALGTTTKGFNSGDRVNRVTWGDLDSGIIAMNAFWYNPAMKVIVESDVVFSTDYPWSASEEDCPTGAMDLKSIATHEFGHNGLNDLYMPPSVELTMYGYGDFGETHARTLGTGDISGIKALYGA
jgi:hypothetical protein